MTKNGKKFIDYFINGECTIETLQIVYNKGHISAEEFKEVVGREPQEKPTESSMPLEERISAVEEALLIIME